MTTQEAATEAIYQRFVTQWGATSALTFQNEDFNEPEDDPWVRLVVVEQARTQDTLGRAGNRKFRPSGLVVVQVYTRVNTGVKRGLELARQARDIFEATSFSGLDFGNGVARAVGPEGKWFVHSAEVEFDYEEIK